MSTSILSRMLPCTVLYAVFTYQMFHVLIACLTHYDSGSVRVHSAPSYSRAIIGRVLTGCFPVGICFSPFQSPCRQQYLWRHLLEHAG